MTQEETEAGCSLVITTIDGVESAYGTTTINFTDNEDNNHSFNSLLELVRWLNDYLN